MSYTRITGTGSFVPEKRLSNRDLERMVDTSDEWIITRTGISERRLVKEGQATSDLAYEAARKALESANLEPEQLDMIIVATETPDHPFPPVACQLQHRLQCRPIPVFDLHLVCSGFIAALHTADSLMKTGPYRHILVVGADVLSNITDYTDRSTCILFSDGAGAVVLSRNNGQPGGIRHSVLYADGSHLEAAYVPGGGSRYPSPDSVERKAKIVMKGNQIFRLAVQSMNQAVREVLAHTETDVSRLDWIVPHQANQRIIDALGRELGVPEEKMISTIRYLGNNSAATIPIALDLAVKEGKIRRGHQVMLTAFGGGAAWGAVLLEY